MRNTCAISVRRCDRSGPIVAARWLRNCMRSCRQSASRAARHAARFVQRGLQRHGLAEQHEQVAAVDQQGQELAEAAADVPAFRDQQAEPGALAVRRASPEQADRHERRFEREVCGRRVDQRAQTGRDAPIDALQRRDPCGVP